MAADAEPAGGLAEPTSPELAQFSICIDGRVGRRYEGARGAVVECDVFPVNTMRIEPLRPGPYLFATPEPAARFINEVLLALEYLGCTIS